MSTFNSGPAFSLLENFLSLVEADCGLNWGDLSHLHRWAPYEINWLFLRGFVDFWDPEDHCFRIGLDELCSTMEEFMVMKREDISWLLASLWDGRSPRIMLAELLDI